MRNLDAVRDFLRQLREGKAENPLSDILLPSLQGAVDRYEANMSEYMWLIAAFERMLRHVELSDEGNYRIKKGHAAEYFAAAAKIKRLGSSEWRPQESSKLKLPV